MNESHAASDWKLGGTWERSYHLVPWLSQYMNFEPWLQASLLQIVTQCGGVHVPCLVTTAEISMMSTGEMGFHVGIPFSMVHNTRAHKNKWVAQFSSSLRPTILEEDEIWVCSLVPRPPLFLPSICVHNNTREWKTGEKRSSNFVYCYERKWKVIMGEA